jgi:peptide/nickel transport system permease protein
VLGYAARRLALAIPLIVVVATLTFFLVQLVGGSPAGAVLGANATEEQVRSFDEELGLDRPVLVQFGDWFGSAIRGDLGVSFLDRQQVTDRLVQALPPTLSLAIVATLLTLGLGLVLGMVAAVRGGRTDRFVQAFANLGMAIPNFWLAAVLIFFFAIELAVFPVGGYTELTESPGDWLLHLVLPAVALSIANLGQIAFQTRAAVQHALSREFVRTLHATGTPRWRILFKHVLRNAAIPVVTVTGLSFIFTLGGVVVLELIFGMSGMGLLMLNSVQGSDYAVVQGAVVLFAVLVVVVNLVVDLATAALDPRVRVR